MAHINIVATIKVKPIYTDAVIQFFKTELINQSRAEEGNIQYDLHRGLEDQNTLLMYETWASKQAIDSHKATEHFEKFQTYIADKAESVDITLVEKLRQ